MRLDYREKFPSGMEEYLSMYGWHFSKKMCEWASSKMYKRVGGRKEYIEPYTKETLDALIRQYGVKPEKDVAYDAVYVANMCKADFLGSSIRDEMGLIMYVKDVIDDPDGYEGLPFTRFYADCIGSGTPISWEDVI
mgnify:CR=1 FL=1